MTYDDKEYLDRTYRDGLRDVQSSNSAVRRFGIVALGSAGYYGNKHAISILAQLLQSERDEDIRLDVIHNLARTGQPEALSALRSAVFDPSWRVRAELVNGILESLNQASARERTKQARGQMPVLYKQAISFLALMTQDPHPYIREEAESLMENFTEALATMLAS